ncbi:MAG: GntR family transcriptional regulator [Chloroflexi bacterium]|nr:GntR family transcriptional regulator [Chloroflexota bacterium]MCL5074880.1 GntR family transcriptional regulator [Chloroflexota bacterium]
MLKFVGHPTIWPKEGCGAFPESPPDRGMRLKTDPRPLYIQAEEVLVELLNSGAYQPGQKLPPEPILARQMGIARHTLREAIRQLEREGRLLRRQGVGTFVRAARPLIRSGLEMLESLESLAAKQGMACTTRDIAIEEAPAPKTIATRLHLPEGTAVTTLTRIKTVNGEPVAYMYSAIPQEVATTAQLRAGFQDSIIDFLVAWRHPPLEYARAEIISTAAEADLSRLLNVDASTILLLIEETFYSDTDQPIGFSANYFVPGFFKFEVVRRIPSLRP